LDLTSAAGCAAALQSPNQATRYAAWTKLRQMQGDAEKELTTLWNGDDARMRARALHLLARIKGSEKKYVEQAIHDSNPDIRITGLRIARELQLDVIAYVKTLAGDRRRRSAASLPSPCATIHLGGARLWAHAARTTAKTVVSQALGIGADNQWDKFLDAWLGKREINGTPPDATSSGARAAGRPRRCW
jgi:hypothetical protein